MQKKYVLDTNILMENEKSIEILKNGVENQILIPATVFEELDGLKKNSTKRFQVARIMLEIEKYKDYIQIIGDTDKDTPDNKILETIQRQDDDDLIFVTNDNILRLKAYKKGFQTEEFKNANPFQSESEKYTGFVDLYDSDGNPVDLSQYPNSFYFDERGGLYFYKNAGENARNIDDTCSVWNVHLWDAYQKAAVEMITDRSVPLVSIQSTAGKGKTFISLASCLYMLLQKKWFKKLVIIKSNHEVGETLGFRPGAVEEKFEPIIKPIKNLLYKLHDTRPANKIFIDPSVDQHMLEFNPKIVEFMTLNFARGENIEDAVVLIDETQNFSRNEMRTLLSRCGENTKVICTGDTQQVDSPYLSPENNGINWIVKTFRGDTRYGHVVLQGKKSRGPICDLVKERGL